MVGGCGGLAGGAAVGGGDGGFKVIVSVISPLNLTHGGRPSFPLHQWPSLAAELRSATAGGAPAWLTFMSAYVTSPLAFVSTKSTVIAVVAVCATEADRVKAASSFCWSKRRPRL